MSGVFGKSPFPQLTTVPSEHENFDLYKRGKIKLDELVGGHFSLAEINQDIAMMRDGSVARVVLDL